MIIACMGYLGFFFNPTDSMTVTMVLVMVIGLGGSALPVMYYAMLPDTIEYGEAMTGIRAEAKTFGFSTFAQKSAVGINAMLLGLLLTAIDFQANQAQAPDTLLAMKAIMALVPAFGTILVLLLLKGYDLDTKRHSELKDIILQRSKIEPAK